MEITSTVTTSNQVLINGELMTNLNLHMTHIHKKPQIIDKIQIFLFNSSTSHFFSRQSSHLLNKNFLKFNPHVTQIYPCGQSVETFVSCYNSSQYSLTISIPILIYNSKLDNHSIKAPVCQ